MHSEGDRTDGGKHSAFPTTQWSLILRAGRTNCPEVAFALERLCRAYWFPLYAFVRRRGETPHDAQDLTQSFFVHLFEQDALKNLDREKGKFRSFLLAAFNNFRRNQKEKRDAQKRGGSHEVISWNSGIAEELYAKDAAANLEPLMVFDRSWARALVDAALERLRREHEAQGKEELFEKLHRYLTRETDAQFHRLGLNLTPNAAKVALHRLRRRFGVLLRSEVAYTVSDPDQVEEELRHLLAAIGE